MILPVTFKGFIIHIGTFQGTIVTASCFEAGLSPTLLSAFLLDESIQASEPGNLCFKVVPIMP